MGRILSIAFFVLLIYNPSAAMAIPGALFGAFLDFTKAIVVTGIKRSGGSIQNHPINDVINQVNQHQGSRN
jgi:hypothetical protein